MLILAALASSAAPPPPVSAEMHQRFALLTAIRDHVVDGELAEAKARARALAGVRPVEGLPADQLARVAAVNAAARQLADATDLPAAALGTARVAVACAACHAETGGGPGLAHAEDVPPQRWDEGQNMPLHEWALDWMWLGLLADDDGAWVRGANELDRQPLAPRFEEAPPPTGMRELEQGVYVLADKALEVESPADRAELYGTLLATCSNCHTLHRPKGAP